MTEKNSLERGIFVASRVAMALLMREAAERVVDRNTAQQLREAVVQDDDFQIYFRGRREKMPHKDPGAELALKSFLIGGMVMYDLVINRMVKFNELADSVRAFCSDGDMAMSIIDICRKEEINDKEGWGKVVDFTRKNAERMLGSIYSAKLRLDQAEAVRREGSFSLTAYQLASESAIIGWLPLEFQAPGPRRVFNG